MRMLRYGYSHMHKELQADLHNINAKGFFLFNRKYKKSDFIGVIIVVPHKNVTFAPSKDRNAYGTQRTYQLYGCCRDTKV